MTADAEAGPDNTGAEDSNSEDVEHLDPAPEKTGWKAHPARVIVLRWLLLIGCVVVAFFPTWKRVLEEASNGAITAYIFVLPFLAAVAAQGVARRRAGELPIHDRQTDVIVGCLALLASIAVKALWLPRYSEQYALAHLDVLSALVFFFGGAILLFGLRPVGRFWSVWLLLLALSPLMYRLVAINAGGSRFAYGAVLVVLGGVAGAIAVGRTRRRAWLGFVCTVATGFAVLAFILALWPRIDVVLMQLIPTVGASMVIGVGFYLLSRRGESKRPLPKGMSSSSAKRSPSSAIMVIVAAVILLALPLPQTTAIPDTAGPPGSTSVPLAPPTGWNRTALQSYDWVRSYFGQTATLTRQTMKAEEGNPEWDIESRPRTVVVDVLSTTNRASLAIYPESTLYRLSNTRTSDSLQVPLGHGVTGTLYTSVSDALLLTWTKLVFTWVRGDVTQRVTIISVDNHEDGATFPRPIPSMASNIGTSLATFLRGNSIIADTEPEYKDRTLLTSFGTGLVRAQWNIDTRGGQ